MVWNSGTEVIEQKDIRRDVTIVLDASSKVIEVRPGLQKSNKVDDFKFGDIGMNSYKLTWEVLDPGDYFEAHFLVGTNLDQASLQKIIQVEGLASGNVRVSLRSLSEILNVRIGITLVLMFLSPWGVIILTAVLVTYNESAKRLAAWVSKFANYKGKWTAIPTILFSIVVAATFLSIIGITIGSYFANVPVWLEPRYFLAIFSRASSVGG
jgi:hypothetical protein